MRLRTLACRAGLLVALVPAAGRAQGYEVGWWTVDGGGVQAAAGGAFVLASTSGQPDAGGPSSNGPYSLYGGFWALAAGGLEPQADLTATKTDGQRAATPGEGVTYTITVGNVGPSAVTGAQVADRPPAELTNVTWTCTATPGSSCPPSGSGPISHAVDLLAGGTATFVMSAVIDPTATGSLTNTASVSPPAGVVDPTPANNSGTDVDTLTPQADLALAMADSPDPVAQGGSLTYAIQVTNAGPSASPSMSVTHTLPASVSFVSASPGAPECTHAGGVVTCGLGGLAPASSTDVTVVVAVLPDATALSSTAAVSGAEPDPVAANNADTETTTVALRPPGELSHGSRLWGDLRGVGSAPDPDLYRIGQEPYSSYEVVVDAASGDVGSGQGPLVERLAEDGTTVLQAATGSGPSRSLRFLNATSAAIDDQRVRVRSVSCTSDCGADDVYRIRAYDTTYRVARFNNSGTQVTVVMLQNPTTEPVDVRVWFWSTGGSLLATHVPAAPIPPKGLLVLPTAGVPGLAGTSGSMTIGHGGPYAGLAGKTVALEPSSGFSFDSPLEPRPR